MNAETSGPVPHDFCTCGCPNALTATQCAGCGAHLDRSSIKLSMPAAAVPAPIPSEPAPIPIVEKAQPVEAVNPLDALRQSLSAAQASLPDEDDSAQGFDFCPQCHAPNALNRATCARCDAPLSREGMIQAGPQPTAIPPDAADDKPRYSRDLRPPRPTTLKSTPPTRGPELTGDFSQPSETAPAVAPAYDFCSCGVPNALTATFCAGCGKDLERSSSPAISFAPPRPAVVRGGGADLTKRLIEQGAQRLTDTVTPSKPTNTESVPQEDGAPVYDFCKCGVPNSLTSTVCAGCGEVLGGRSKVNAVARPAVEPAAPAYRPNIDAASAVYCTRCGVPNQDDALFCAGCGNALSKAVAASNVQAGGDPYLSQTTTPARPLAGGQECPACGSSNTKNATLCFTCGARLRQKPAAASASSVAGLAALPKYRNPLIVFVLSLCSLDLYRAYWNYAITNEVQNCLQEKVADPSMTVLAFFGSCGLYDFYWDWVFAKRIALMMEIAGIEPVDYSGLFLFLNLTVVGRVAIPALMQINLNEINSSAAWNPMS